MKGSAIMLAERAYQERMDGLARIIITELFTRRQNVKLVEEG